MLIRKKFKIIFIKLFFITIIWNRFLKWEEKYNFIEKHNSNPKHKTKLGYNEYSHLTQQEIDATLKGFDNRYTAITQKLGIGSKVFWSTFNGITMKMPINYFAPTLNYTAPASVGKT